jgi:DNA replication protein DnaC
MRQAADRMMRDMANGAAPYWLSFVGGCGNGKTLLAREVFRFQKRNLRVGDWRESRGGILTNGQPGVWCDWSTYAAEVSEFKTSRREILLEAWLLVLDDVGADSGRQLVKDELFRVLNARLGRWTIVTCNLTPQGIASQIDARVASRLIRDGNLLIQNTGPDWALKKAGMRR